MNGFDVEVGSEWVAIMEGVADDTVSQDELTQHIENVIGNVPIDQ